MPFADESPGRPIGHGVTDDVITRLAKLRALFVIARGSAYALGDRGIGAQEAGRLLGVDYVASGCVRADAHRIAVRVELAETTTARIVWTDDITAPARETFDVLDTIVDRIVAAIAEEVEAEECRRAILKPPASLDAWEAYHRGLWHMYRFTPNDNHEAARFFRRALELDATFARAYSGLSFTHFQNVFLDLTPDRDAQLAQTFTTAAASLSADERDPTAHWAMGRALWLRGETTESVGVLQRCIALSPNFALGHYMLGFVEAQSGDPNVAIAESNTSRALSPFDPLQFGMLGLRALAHMRRGEHAEAAIWAQRAAARPNAHAHIIAIAASMLALNGRRDDARKLVARIRERLPAYDVDGFLRAFRFERDAERLLRSAAKTFDFG
jgi:TolB-like protein/Flp pilus assembly protein TadD